MDSDLSSLITGKAKELLGEAWAEFHFIIGVSGGLDSTVLLYALSQHFERKNIYPVHFNYHLRGEESNGDQAFVEEVCVRLGLSCDVQHRYYEQDSQQGNLQDWARGVRYKHLSTVLPKGKAAALTAHHAQDQAETILMRIMQGYPPFMCSGMEDVQPWKSGRNLIRPMLNTWPEEILEYAKAIGLTWREDSSNKKDDYLRNRVRHHVLPGLETAFGPNWGDNLINFGRSLAATHYGETSGLSTDSYGNPSIPFNALETAPYPWLVLDKLTGHYITPGKAGEIVRTLKANRLKTVKLEFGTLIRERDDTIIFIDKEQELLLIIIKALPRVIPLPDGRIAWLESSTAPEVELMIRHSSSSIFYINTSLPLTIRAWRVGDTITPLGAHGTQKRLKHLVKNLTNIVARETAWVLESNSEIVFASMGLLAEIAAVKPGQACLKLSLQIPQK